MTTPIDYALMAGASYISTRSGKNQFSVPQGWTEQIDKRQALPSGFEATYFTNGNEIIISFAGTYDDGNIINPDKLADAALGLGMWSDQLGQAADYYLQVMAANAANPDAHITLTGHSLGGGLASLIGVFFGVEAHTFDQAPFAEAAKFQAQSLMDYLVNEGKYTDTQLAGLAHFIQLQQLDISFIPNEDLVTNISVEGQLLADFPYSIN